MSADAPGRPALARTAAVARRAPLEALRDRRVPQGNMLGPMLFLCYGILYRAANAKSTKSGSLTCTCIFKKYS